jgi:hypothetical protein
MKYRLEVIWNREFAWRRFGAEFDSVIAAKKYAVAANGPEGDRIKEARVVNVETKEVVWEGYP